MLKRTWVIIIDGFENLGTVKPCLGWIFNVLRLATFYHHAGRESPHFGAFQSGPISYEYVFTERYTSYYLIE